MLAGRVALSNHMTAAKQPTSLALRSKEVKPLFTWPALLSMATATNTTAEVN